MGNIFTSIVTWLTLAWFWVVLTLAIIVLAVFRRWISRLFGFVFIGENPVGIVNKKLAFGDKRTLPNGKIIALHGEAGFQADTLPPGLHWGYWPGQYAVDAVELLAIPHGKIGVVEACDGEPLPQGRVLGRRVACDSFQNARAFLENGGERGPQLAIIPPGSYRINTALFNVTLKDAQQIPDTMVGVVTTQEGTPLAKDEIAGRVIEGHNAFQDSQAFIDKGGSKGRQEEVILAGTYYINPRFATVELVPMTEVPIAHAGVVVSFVGDAGVDQSGEEFTQGVIVKKGQKGVWEEVLDPGRYPINPYTQTVKIVPTANVVLNWADETSEAHQLDEGLCTIKVRSADGFDFKLDVSQIIHISRKKAPLVIAGFGSVQALVTQVLEPVIGNYFRNAAQHSDVIDFLLERETRQQEACRSIQEQLAKHNVEAVDTLIGDIVPPPELMKTLTDRKIAGQQKETYRTQREAEEERQELEKARALAAMQTQVVAAERSVQIAEFAAQAAVKQAEGEANSKTLVAKADAQVLQTLGEAEGKKITAVGDAEASIVQKKINAMDPRTYALIEIAKVMAANKIKLVPDISAGSANGGATLVDALVGTFLQGNAPKKDVSAGPVKENSESGK